MKTKTFNQIIFTVKKMVKLVEKIKKKTDDSVCVCRHKKDFAFLSNSEVTLQNDIHKHQRNKAWKRKKGKQQTHSKACFSLKK